MRKFDQGQLINYIAYSFHLNSIHDVGMYEVLKSEHTMSYFIYLYLASVFIYNRDIFFKILLFLKVYVFKLMKCISFISSPF